MPSYGLRYDNNGNAYPIENGILANFHRGTGSSFADPDRERRQEETKPYAEP